MRSYLYQGPRRIRLLELTITSDILDLTNLYSSEYSCFSLKLIGAAKIFCAAKASAPGILSAEYTIVAKERLRYRQA